MLEQNKKYFSEKVKEYEVSYLRDDEKYLADKYFKKGGNILVLGCGAGRTLTPLYESGLNITAIDIVPKMVEASKKRIVGLPINIIEMDATDLKFEDDSFDYVFFPFHGIDCIYPDIYKCVKEVARVLKSDGVFIFNSHNRFFLKTLTNIFSGKYADYYGVVVYRSTLFDYFCLKRYFEKVKIKQRISMQKWENSNWKDICYKIFPILNKSTYFICQNPIKNICD